MSSNGWYPGVELIDRQLSAAGAWTVTLDAIHRRDATYHARIISYDSVTEEMLECDTPDGANLADEYTISQIIGVCRALDKPPLDVITIECLRCRLCGWTVAELSKLTDMNVNTISSRLRRVIPRVARAMPSSEFAALRQVMYEAYMRELRSSWNCEKLRRELKKRPRW